jgi:hypothetical protein
VLETDDDGRLNSLIDRFTALVGKAVPPAHPRTKVIGQSNRSEHALSWHWYLPPDLSDVEKKRLTHEQMASLVTTVWPETPVAYFGGRTPLQLARTGGAETSLRAAVLRMEQSGDDWGGQVDWQSLRERLGIPPEPGIDPETVEIDRLPVCRLNMVPVRRLDNDRLLQLYGRAHEWGLTGLVFDAAHELVERPGVRWNEGLDEFVLYGDLAVESTGQRDRGRALDWIARGRGVQPGSRNPEIAALWDMLELQIKTSFDEPEDWVPELVVVLDRYRQNEKATMSLTSRLLEMGLLRIMSSPDRPGELVVDSRPLNQLIDRYGPKVTTAGGYLGVSATRGEIWTPDSGSKGSAIWTPGSDSGDSSTGEGPRIILPGQ